MDSLVSASRNSQTRQELASAHSHTMNGGKRFPQAAQLYKLAKALGVSTEYLKNDEIEDPSYGMDRMDYVEEMRRQGGRRESLDLEAMLRDNQALFAGGTISEEAKDAYFQAVMKAYLECKEAAKETYGRKKKPASSEQ